MRFVATLFFVLLIGLQNSLADEDSNYLYAMSLQGGPTITRYAKPEFVEAMRSSRPDGVMFNWIYRAPNEAESGAFDQQVAAINEAVAEVLKVQPRAILALASIRANNQGVWAFYTDDGPALSFALEAGLQGRTTTPVKFRVGKDPEWKAIARFLSRVRDENDA